MNESITTAGHQIADSAVAIVKYALMMTLALSWGCASDFEMAAADLDTATGDLSEEIFDGYRLRVDVLPTVSAGDDLLAQSFWLDEVSGWDDLPLALQPTVQITGSVSGFAANPYGIQVPGASDVPVLSEVTLYRPDTIVSSTVSTDDDGTFVFSLPAGEGYRLAVLPTEPLELPFYIESDIPVSQNEDLGEISLEYGDPIYGTVANSAGGAIIDCIVRLIDATTGVEGVATQTDTSGFYMLRADPGDYIVQIEPATGIILPTIQTPVSFEADLGGVNVDVDVGVINPVLVRGIPRTADGEIMRDAVVRLIATDLAQTSGSMVVETETDQSGEFLVYALPGEWTMEIIPPAEDGDLNAPLEEALSLVGIPEVYLTDLQLSELFPFERYVVDADGDPVAGVLVTFQEQGFNHATYTAYTDSAGYLNIFVPDVPLDVLLTPTTNLGFAVARRELLNPAADGEDIWHLSAGVKIKGVVERPDGTAGLSIIEVHDDTGVFYGSTLTSGDGAFEIKISP